jgi:trehalose 6-phosphate phosphatase
MAPVASHPDLVTMPGPVRDVLGELAADHVVCVVSGRDLADVRRKVGLPDLYYAGDHGYRIAGPAGSGVELEVGGPQERLELETASYELERRLRPIAGVVVEAKGTSLSVHYRLVAEDRRPLVDQIVHEVADSAPGLKLTAGKLVHELRPHLPWDKGKAVLWLMGQLRLHRDEVCPICVGDDLTDEDMFVAVRRWGLSVVVGECQRTTRAHYRVDDPAQVLEFLRTFATGEGDKPPLPM